MGLERAAAVLQGKPNVYETDLFRPIIDAVCRLTGKEYGENVDTDYAIRVVAEHARAASFLISDGVVPSNSERGYVLRRIIRRAIRYGRQLGLDRPFMTEVAGAVIERFAAAYPTLGENGDFIRRVLSVEEDRFTETFESGIEILQGMMIALPRLADALLDAQPGDLLVPFSVALPKEIEGGADVGNLAIGGVHQGVFQAMRWAAQVVQSRIDPPIAGPVEIRQETADQFTSAIPGGLAFVLYDTYGFPPELVDEIGRREYGLAVDMDGFNSEMEAKRERDRAGHQVTGSMEIVTDYDQFTGRAEPRHHAVDAGSVSSSFDVPQPEVTHTPAQITFVGYDSTLVESRILGILREGEAVGHATRGQQVEIVLAETCFYAEGGGQVGDRGVIAGPNGRVQVEDTQSPVAGLVVHRGVVSDGDIALGEAVTARVEAERRLDASRNHSGTHLLHAALRSVLGLHVRQAGSLCAPGRLRFDFNHMGAMTYDEQLEVQVLANRKVRENLSVTAQETTYTDAVQAGALAFFGDRYGDVVRVVRMAGHDDHEDPFSFEVCGGTHVHATGEVGTLVVLGESSIGGGMRRIEAMTGRAAEELFVQQSATLEAISRKLQAPVSELEARLDTYMADTETLRRRLADAERTSLRSEAESLLDRVRDVNGVKLVAGVTSAHNVEAMREMGDFLKQKLDSVAVALGAVIDGSPIIVTMLTPDLVSRGLHAGNIARDAAKIMGGGGGGRPETAQAGGRRPDRLGAALDSVANLVREGLNS